MYLAYVSYNQLDEYLSFLMTSGLLLKTEGPRTLAREGKATYTTTSRGKEFLLKYGELSDLLETDFTFKAGGAPSPPS